MSYDPWKEVYKTYGDFVKEIGAHRYELFSFKGKMYRLKVLSFHCKNDPKLLYFYVGKTFNIKDPFEDETTPVDVSHFKNICDIFEMFSKFSKLEYLPFSTDESPKLFRLEQ
jgi:hypothetical protein